MSKNGKYSLLKRILKALGLPDARVDELIARIQEWLLDDKEKEANRPRFPYKLHDTFLSPAELHFYRALEKSASDRMVIAPKVRLGDLFAVKTGEEKFLGYLNRINRGHVDFLLCDSQTMKPLLGVELDDKSHKRAKRQKRDRFVNGVFDAAGLPLVRINARREYDFQQLSQLLRKHLQAQPSRAEVTASSVEVEPQRPACPKCGDSMILRTAKKGANKGDQFWGCSAYPRCYGSREYEPVSS